MCWFSVEFAAELNTTVLHALVRAIEQVHEKPVLPAGGGGVVDVPQCEYNS